jgi:hypothetical protein
MILDRRTNRADRLQRRLSPFFAQRVTIRKIDSASRFAPRFPFFQQK